MKLPGLAGIYPEDSYVLAIHQCEARFAFELEAVLTPESPAYVPPRPGEQYCYAMATLVFPNVTAVEWIRRSGRHYPDAAGEEDLGNIDLLDVEGHEKEVGKKTGKDAAAGKSTFVSLLGPQRAHEQAEVLADQAASHLEILGEKSKLLQELAHYVVNRRA